MNLRTHRRARHALGDRSDPRFIWGWGSSRQIIRGPYVPDPSRPTRYQLRLRRADGEIDWCRRLHIVRYRHRTSIKNGWLWVGGRRPGKATIMRGLRANLTVHDDIVDHIGLRLP